MSIQRVVSVIVLAALVMTAVVSVPFAGAQSPPVWVQGSPIDGANGLNFGPDGYLYVASVFGMEIVVMDPVTGEIIDRLGPDRGGGGADDLTFGPDGSLCWTSIFTGEVVRRAPDGTVTRQFVAPSVNPITFSDDGRLFVAKSIVENDGLYEVDPNLIEPPRLLSEQGVNGMDWGSDAFLYAPIPFEGRIVRIDVTTDPATFETLIETPLPTAVKFSPQGDLYAVTGLGEVLKLDAAAKTSALVAQLPSSIDNLAFDADGHLYVSGYQDGFIFEVLADGTTRAVVPGGITSPGGVAVRGDSVFVADLWSLRELDRRTGQEVYVERFYFDPATFVEPMTVAVDGDNLILSDGLTNTVQVWNITSHETVETYFDIAFPLNAIRFQGDLVIAEMGTSSVVRLQGQERVTLADADAGIVVPAGLAATEDALWVGDWATGTVWQLVADGQPLTEPLVVASGLAFPEGLAVATDGTLLVVETGKGSVKSINLTSGEVSTVADGLVLGMAAPEGMWPTWWFNGIAVDADGAIYVTGDAANAVYRIMP